MALRPLKSINLLIIHCADTPNGRHTTAEEIDGWHAKRRFRRQPDEIGHQAPRLQHIGYHYVICLSGAVISARGLREVGAHAHGHNTRSIGVCLIGRDRFTRAQWDTLRAHVELQQRRFPGIKIIGHRDVDANKTCPGFDVAAWLANGMEPLPDHLVEDN